MRLTIIILGTLLMLLFGITPRVGAEDSHCIQHGTKHAYLCYYHARGTGGGVYATLVLFENWYYWHPFKGLQAVDETFSKGAAPGRTANGPRTDGYRRIGFSDGRVITDAYWLSHFGHNNEPPVSCSHTACTANEEASAMGFQWAMVKDEIHHSF